MPNLVSESDCIEAGKVLLHAHLTGNRLPLTNAMAWCVLTRYPWATIKTIATIHVEAARLYLKGLRWLAILAPPVTNCGRRPYSTIFSLGRTTLRRTGTLAACDETSRGTESGFGLAGQARQGSKLSIFDRDVTQTRRELTPFECRRSFHHGRPS